MNVNPLIVDALKGIGFPVQWLRYTGNAKEYITFNDSDNRPSLWGDNEAIMDTVYSQIHYFTPDNPKSTAKKIRKQLRNANFTVISTTELYEEDTGLYHTVIDVVIAGENETQQEDD